MKEREALKLALEALKHGGCPPDCKDGMTDSGGVHPWGEAALIPCPNCQAVTAIKEALAQPEQEPVYLVWLANHCAWLHTDKNGFDKTDPENRWTLYTTPPQRTWVGLTDDDKDVSNLAYSGMSSNYIDGYEFGMEAAEYKLKEKNT